MSLGLLLYINSIPAELPDLDERCFVLALVGYLTFHFHFITSMKLEELMRRNNIATITDLQTKIEELKDSYVNGNAIYRRSARGVHTTWEGEYKALLALEKISQKEDAKSAEIEYQIRSNLPALLNPTPDNKRTNKKPDGIWNKAQDLWQNVTGRRIRSKSQYDVSFQF